MITDDGYFFYACLPIDFLLNLPISLQTYEHTCALSLSLPLSLSIFLSPSLSLSVCAFLSLYLSLFLPLSFSLSISLSPFAAVVFYPCSTHKITNINTHTHTHAFMYINTHGRNTFLAGDNSNGESRIIMVQNLFPNRISLYFDDMEAGAFLTNIKPQEKVRIKVSSGMEKCLLLHFSLIFSHILFYFPFSLISFVYSISYRYFITN